MGLFDRLLGSRSVKATAQESGSQAKKKEESFFLDADASSSLGDVNFMRRSNTIRRTFPGNADSPGEKELVAEVASMEARIEAMTPGLAGVEPESTVKVDLTGGVPKPVKKTFAKPMSQAELDQRMKGSAVAVNSPGGPAAAPRSAAPGNSTSAGQSGATAKPGAIDPFKSMAKDLNS